MKYFTREYWLALQSTGFTPALPEHDPFALYRADLEALRGRMTPAAFQFFSDADVHDGELLSFAVMDGNRPAPQGQPAREWTWQPGFPVRATLRAMDAYDRLVWTLEYSEVRHLNIRYNAEADLFRSGSGGGFGFGDWGYHELRDAGGGFLAHEILFATGATILVEFRQVTVRSEPARAAADENVTANETRDG
jgi:hypothetical protein